MQPPSSRKVYFAGDALKKLSAQNITAILTRCSVVKCKNVTNQRVTKLFADGVYVMTELETWRLPRSLEELDMFVVASTLRKMMNVQQAYLLNCQKSTCPEELQKTPDQPLVARVCKSSWVTLEIDVVHHLCCGNNNPDNMYENYIFIYCSYALAYFRSNAEASDFYHCYHGQPWALCRKLPGINIRKGSDLEQTLFAQFVSSKFF